MSCNFDVGIIGSGISGTFAALRIANKYKKVRTILFDIGRPPAKRRRPLEGFLGCFPTGNGRIYPNNLDDLYAITDGRKITHSHNWIMNYFKEVNPMRLIKDAEPCARTKNRLEKYGYSLSTNNYYQWRPESVHKLSRIVTAELESAPNLFFSFDNEVSNIAKNNKCFTVSSDGGTFTCRKLIVCVGRSGWRWITELFDEFSIPKMNNIATYGVRLELPSQHLKGFNKSHCILTKDDLTVGPFNWFGTVVPEDHADFVVSAFRSNEDRWKSDKVSFSLLKSIEVNNDGVEQTERVGKLAFLLFNDRVNKERVRSFLRGNSAVSPLPEYSWLTDALKDVQNVVPGLLDHGYMHLPHIKPMAAKIKLSGDLESPVDGMFISGESGNINGILGAAVSGCIAANGACRSMEARTSPARSKNNFVDNLFKVLKIMCENYDRPVPRRDVVKKLGMSGAAAENMISEALKTRKFSKFSIRRGRNGGITYNGR